MSVNGSLSSCVLSIYDPEKRRSPIEEISEAQIIGDGLGVLLRYGCQYCSSSDEAIDP